MEGPRGELPRPPAYVRVVRWLKRRSPSDRAADAANHLETMHAITREKGRSVRRTYFIDETVNRFAARIGMSRQRVMARLLDDGLVDVMIRSADQVKVIPMRDTPTLLKGRVSEALNTLEFYYRAREGMREGIRDLRGEKGSGIRDQRGR